MKRSEMLWPCTVPSRDLLPGSGKGCGLLWLTANSSQWHLSKGQKVFPKMTNDLINISIICIRNLQVSTIQTFSIASSQCLNFVAISLRRSRWSHHLWHQDLIRFLSSCLGCSTLNLAPCLIFGEDSGLWCKCLGHCHPYRRPRWSSGSGLWHSAVLIAASIRKWTRAWRISLSPLTSLSLCLSNKINV